MHEFANVCLARQPSVNHLLDLQSLKGQKREMNIFVSICSAVDDMKLQWSKVTGIITDGVSAMAGE